MRSVRPGLGCPVDVGVGGPPPWLSSQGSSPLMTGLAVEGGLGPGAESPPWGRTETTGNWAWPVYGALRSGGRDAGAQWRQGNVPRKKVSSYHSSAAHALSKGRDSTSVLACRVPVERLPGGRAQPAVSQTTTKARRLLSISQKPRILGKSKPAMQRCGEGAMLLKFGSARFAICHPDGCLCGARKARWESI